MLKTFEQFKIHEILQPLYEYRLVYKKEFIDALKNIKNPIAKDILELKDEDNKNIDINRINSILDSDSVEYLSDKKIDKQIEKSYGQEDDRYNDIVKKDDEVRDLFADEAKPIKAKIGKVVNKILSLSDKKYKSSEIEDFVNKYIGYINYKNKSIKFEIWNGEKISQAYLKSNYDIECNSELDKSCMSEVADDIPKIFKLYSKSPKIVSTLILLNDKNKIIGRSLLWNKVNGEDGNEYKVMDRVYCGRSADVELFRKWCVDNNYIFRYIRNNDSDKNRFKFLDSDEEKIELKLYVDLNITDLDYYPYLDTFSYLVKEKNRLYNYKPKYDYILLNDTVGGYMTMEGEYIEPCKKISK